MIEQTVAAAWNESFLSHVSFANTAWLYLLPLAFLLLLLRRYVAFSHPAIQYLPQDALSVWLARIWRVSGVLMISMLCLGLAQPYLTAQLIEKTGRGAHVMIVLDRSASMNDSFANQAKASAISKMEAARNVLKTLVKKGNDDLVGMVSFSTSPILTAPLSTDRTYVQAALDATEAGGMGFTAVARGLGLALDYFEGKPVTGARAIVLVSDGGAHLDGKTQDMLRAMFIRQNASLYWIYLRSANGTSLKRVPSVDEGIDAYPEYALHEYFGSLHVPYHVYEAENPEAVEIAMQDIARLKNKPTRYLEAVSRTDLSWICYGLAWLFGLMLLGIYTIEIKSWRGALGVKA